jgi:hypothetical protein
MRCPTCGTENTPDSRFCGGCGAKLVPEVSRVAPTAKISDDATFPPQRYPTPVPAQNYASGPASIPPNTYQAPPGPASIPPNTYRAPQGPASIPPASIPPNTYQAPASIPPTNSPASIPPNTYQARPASIPPTNAGYAPREPSMSMPIVPQARWGLIVFVLLLDIGLAAAGAVMLQKGLAKPDPAPASDGSAHATTTTTQAAPPPAVTAPAPSPDVSASIATVANAAKPDAAKPDAAKSEPAKPEPVPVVQAKKSPPPREIKNELGAEIELAAARSRGDFDKCYDDASPDIHLKGRIDITFTVLPDGRTDNPHVVQNDTGSQQLASCLGATIARWAFASRPAKPVLITRPFIYN